MSVNVMMIGGHRDGEILTVPGHIEPAAKIVVLSLLPKWRRDDPPPPYSIEPDTITLEIIPRKANSGPAWKIELPKELW